MAGFLSRAGCAAERAARVHGGGSTGKQPKERSSFGVFPARIEAALPEVGEAALSRDDALFALLGGWMAHSGPTTAEELSACLGLPAAEITGAAAPGGEWLNLRGQFTDSQGESNGRS